MAKKNPVFVLYWDDNTPTANVMGNRRCAVYSSFAKAWHDLSVDFDYWAMKGGYIEDEWYNDVNIENATSARVVIRKGDGTIICANIVPSYIY